MWWHGGAGLIERSERGTLSAVATHDLFALGIPEPVDRRISGQSVLLQGANQADERSRRKTRGCQNAVDAAARGGWIMPTGITRDPRFSVTSSGTRVFILFSERLAVAPAKWKLEFKKDVIAGCH